MQGSTKVFEELVAGKFAYANAPNKSDREWGATNGFLRLKAAFSKEW